MFILYSIHKLNIYNRAYKSYAALFESDSLFNNFVFRFLGEGISSSQMTMSSSIRISTERRLLGLRVDFRRNIPRNFFGLGALNLEISAASDLIEEILSFIESFMMTEPKNVS